MKHFWMILAVGVLGFGAIPAFSAPLAVVCDNMTDATNLLTCTGGHYTAHPQASDIVRNGTTWTDFRPAPFGALAPTASVDACKDPSVAEGATYPWPFNATLDPCKDWGVYPASTFATAVNGKAATLNVSWTLPTQATDGTALTGNQALTAIQLFISDAPIPDDSTATPTATFTGDMIQATYNGMVTNGTTLYARVKAVNSAGASAFSAQASKVIDIPAVKPNMPTNVAITLTLK